MTVRTRIAEWVAPATAAAAEMEWEAVYRRELPRVYNFFRYRVGPGPVAEDLTSATFEKAWRARLAYRRDVGAFSTWLLTIARHVAVDHFRRPRRDLPIEAIDSPSRAPTPEQEALRVSDLERLQSLLGELPQRERELIAFKYGSGATNREIAKATGLSESNVGTILHRTVCGLRERWQAKETNR
jgi:RNA polymerase sigma-70 factor (ECF subfamily)